MSWEISWRGRRKQEVCTLIWYTWPGTWTVTWNVSRNIHVVDAFYCKGTLNWLIVLRTKMYVVVKGMRKETETFGLIDFVLVQCFHWWTETSKLSSKQAFLCCLFLKPYSAWSRFSPSFKMKSFLLSHSILASWIKKSLE